MAIMWHTLKQFYNSAQWNHIRKIVIYERSKKTNGNIICEYCGSMISSFGDVEIDHIKELTLENVNDVNVSLNMDNLKIACHNCHNKKHGRFCSTERKVYIVYGAPFSGKNTYVKQNMCRGDLIVSLDRLFEAISYLPLYDKPDLLKYNVFSIRNALIDNIKTRYGKYKNAWVIGGYANKHDREHIKKELCAELIYIQATKEECLQRLEYCQDNRKYQKAEYKRYIEKWFDEFTA